MFDKIRVSRWLIGAAILALAECASVVAIGVALTSPAQAQWFGGDDSYRRQRPQRSGGGFFGNLFGPSERQQYYQGDYPPQQRHIQQQQPADNSRAPSPHKQDVKSDQPAPTTSVVVMGDGMADWLAYGLENAFADAPEIGILRKNKPHSGLLRYDAKGDLDWWREARDLLAKEKPNYIVMMLGVSDRQDIRERDLAKEADRKAKEQKEKSEADKSAPAPAQADDPNQSAPIAPEPPRGKKANGVVEFRSDEWQKIYTRRIDETIAALKSKGVPVFWVGLPSIRGTKSTADAVYLNNLYRARAEKAGIVYIDVWDGFVDEDGKYTNFGPDYEGQNRRLRSGDGVFFTKYGARKLAHYVERELRRYMSNRVPIALPSGPIGPMLGDGKPAARPLAGPVVPLTVTPANSDVLLGGAGSSGATGDAIATQVLVKGEPVAAPPGRADDFNWPPGSEARAAVPIAAAAAPAAAKPMPASPAVSSAAPVTANAAAPAQAVPAPAAPALVPPVASPAPAASEASISADAPPAASDKKPEAAKNRIREKTVQNARPRRLHPAATRPRPHNNAPRPPQPVGQQRRGGGLFDIFR